MSDPEHRIVEYERLNLLGKAVYVGGQVARALGELLDAAVERTADIIGEAEKAFREALDEPVEEAKILDEAPPDQNQAKRTQNQPTRSHNQAPPDRDRA